MNKRVLILNWRCPKNPLSGGAEKVTLEHAKAWAKKGMDVTWLAGNYPVGIKEELIDGVKVVRYGSPISIYFMAPFLYWFKWSGNFDLVIDEIHGVPFLSPLWAWKSKKLAYIHEVAQEIWDDMLPFPINILGKLYEKIYFLFYRRTPFLTASNSTKEDLIRYGISPKQITIIPHGLFIKPVTSIPTKENELTLLFVGRLVKMKGIEKAISIFAEIHKQEPRSKFWIVGNGENEYNKQLKRIITQLGLEKFVTFYGFVDEKKKIELFQRAHYLIHTSVREGFGLVVIEANSQGTPVLALMSPGLRDTVNPGRNGYLIDSNNISEVVRSLTSIKNMLEYKKLSLSAIKTSLLYNWTIITANSYSCLQSLLNDKL